MANALFQVFCSGVVDIYAFYNIGKEREWPEGSGNWRLPPPPQPHRVQAFITACALAKKEELAELMGASLTPGAPSGTGGIF